MKHLLFLFTITILIFGCNSSKDSSSSGPSERPGSNDADLSQYGVKESIKNVMGGLKVGDLAPDFELELQNGNLQSLSNALVSSEVLLVFYRGHWCPICNRHLSALQEEYEGLKKKGIKIYAISPESSEYAMEIVDKNNLDFPVFIDKDHEVMKKYKVLFEVTDEYSNKVIKHLDKNIAHVNGDKDAVLPIPATYLIGKDRKIKYVHYDPNYKSRSTVADIVESI